MVGAVDGLARIWLVNDTWAFESFAGSHSGGGRGAGHPCVPAVCMYTDIRSVDLQPVGVGGGGQALPCLSRRLRVHAAAQWTAQLEPNESSCTQDIDTACTHPVMLRIAPRIASALTLLSVALSLLSPVATREPLKHSCAQSSVPLEAGSFWGTLSHPKGCSG